MKPIEPPDAHFVRAAEGWLELGNLQEATAELDHVGADCQQHPLVLHLRWQISAANRNWLEAYRVAELLVKLAPDEPGSWIQRAYAARRIPGGTVAEARELLLPAATQFPRESLILFNLACYACQLGHLPEARKWLHRAMQTGKTSSIRQLALEEPDLQPLWPELADGSGDTLLA